MTREEIVALAERCEKATRPDRELDFYIWAALNDVTEITNPAEGHPMTPGKGGRVEGKNANGEWHLYGFVDPGEVARNWTPYGGEGRYPAFTASLDAAMTLVPEGWGYSICPTSALLTRSTSDHGVMARAATPALALTAAALRAKAASL